MGNNEHLIENPKNTIITTEFLNDTIALIADTYKEIEREKLATKQYIADKELEIEKYHITKTQETHFKKMDTLNIINKRKIIFTIFLSIILFGGLFVLSYFDKLNGATISIISVVATSLFGENIKDIIFKNIKK